MVLETFLQESVARHQPIHIVQMLLVHQLQVAMLQMAINLELEVAEV